MYYQIINRELSWLFRLISKEGYIKKKTAQVFLEDLNDVQNLKP
jgi:hypothetical protein